MVAPIFETINALDVRAVLPAIRVPTLILHRRDDRLIDVANARYLAANIPGARYLELPGEDHVYFAGTMLKITEIAAFTEREPNDIWIDLIVTEVVSRSGVGCDRSDA